MFRGLLLMLSCVLVALPSTACVSAAPAQGPTGTAFFDDFAGPAGSRPDPSRWNYDIGPSSVHGWEAGTLQTYTDSGDNVRLDGQGHLVIEARRSGQDYTSGRLNTLGKMEMLYGRISARIKVPSGQGLWPAFWLLGADGPWPQTGEIDIMELPNTAAVYQTTLHGPIDGAGASDSDLSPTQQAQFSGPIGDLSTDFHEYWMEREPENITVGIDQQVIGVFTPSSLRPGSEWVFDHPMYAVLNVAVGGDWPGPPDNSTPFPATMLVNWFRFDPMT